MNRQQLQDWANQEETEEDGIRAEAIRRSMVRRLIPNAETLQEQTQNSPIGQKSTQKEME